jgi:CheY-like chemotaxis protein
MTIPILVIEDDDDDYLEIETRLIEAGEDLDLQRCTRLNDALALLERQMQFDLVLVDLSLPGLVNNAVDYAYDVIRKRLPNAKIIVLTGNQDPRLAKQIKDSGGEFLIKIETLCGDSKTLMVRLLKFLMAQQIQKQIQSQQKSTNALRVEFAQLREQWQSIKVEMHLLERRSLYIENDTAKIKDGLKNYRSQINSNGNNAKLALEAVVRLKQQQPQSTLAVWQIVALIAFAGVLWGCFAIAVYLIIRS